MKLKKVVTLLMVFSCFVLGAATKTNLNVVDIMIAYDQSAVKWLSENKPSTTVDDFAASKIAEMNLCLENSGLRKDFSFRLAGVYEADVDTSVLSLVDILNDVTAKNGAYAKIWSKRDEMGADLFSFITGGDIKSNQLGLGYTLQAPSQKALASESAAEAECNSSWIKQIADGYSFNVCSIVAVANVEEYGYTLAHEIAHNMGCGHALDRGTDMGPGSRFYTFSSGYKYDGENGRHFTVMGYSEKDMTPVPCFSSPSVMYDGAITGSAECDNVRTLRANYKYVAQFRVSKASEEEPSGDDPQVTPDDPQEEEETGLTGEFRPYKALNAVFPYVGAVYDEQSNVVALVQFKAGKMNRAGISKVSATIIGMDGKKKTGKAVQVVCGKNAHAPVMNVKDWGALEIVLGGDGFIGKLAGGYTVKTAVIGALESRDVAFHLSDFDFIPSDYGYALLPYTPDGEPILLAGSKWTARKAATLKYKKMVNSESQQIQYNLLGCGDYLDAAKPNVCGLKLSFTVKTGLFKGSFKVYASNAAVTPDGKSPKLKKYTLNVSGFVVDGTGVGMATCKKPLGQWPIFVY